MTLKPGVRIRGVQPELLLGLMVLEGAFAELGAKMHVTSPIPMVVTSLLDGEHMPKSLHYEGLAADIRSRDLTPDQRTRLLRDARARLGECFELILEADHFHLELSPIGLRARA